MGRWTDREDEHRLPPGLTRVAYDADTQKYTYQDEEGGYFEGGEGDRYGVLTAVAAPSPEEIILHNAELARSNREAVRMMMPFALLVMVFLMGLFWYVGF